MSVARRPPAAGPIRFGSFELDIATGALQKNGNPLHLPPQPARVLTLLASRAGEIVRREEIRQEIWGSETYVDFDEGLNHCIRQIRDALCDQSGESRYIQTVPRRGYRFIAVLEDAPFASIAVLPFADYSSSQDQEYFADGLTDALITSLSKIRALSVISRTSVMRYKQTRKTLPEIARELGVNSVLEGSVACEGGRVRITAQLIEAASDRHLWAEQFEQDLSSILAVQSEIARAVSKHVHVQLLPGEQSRLEHVRTVHPSTYETYLRGMHYLSRATMADTLKGLEYLHRAVVDDPADAQAYAGLALGYVTVAHGSEARADSLNRARAAANTALRLDPHSAEALAALAEAQGYLDWEWDEAFLNFDRALEIRPSHANVYYHRAWFHALFGRMDEAISDHEQARRLDPLNPLHIAWLAELYRWEGRLEEARAEALRSIEISPEFPVGYFVLSLLAFDDGRYEESLAELEKAARGAPNWQWASGPACAEANRIQEARAILAKLEREPRTPWNVHWLVYLHAALGELDKAFHYLEHGPHHAWIPWVRVLPWPGGHALRSDPRLPEYLRRMNLPPLQP
jgi:TolB-like protein/Flp pilus assembly protein TadD